MRNITVSIDDQTLHDVRLWCAERDVSVSRVVQIFLEDLPRLKDSFATGSAEKTFGHPA